MSLTCIGDRSEHAAILSRGESCGALEELPKECRIFVPHPRCNIIGGTITAFEKPLCLLDTQILHIADDCRSCSTCEAALETALRNPALCDDGGNRMWLVEMLAKPILGLTHDRVCMRLTPDKARIRQLALAMPLQKIHFGDVQRLSRTAVAGNDMDRQIVPGGRSARGHNLSAVICKNDIWLRNKAYSWKTPTEEIRITPVRCRRLAIEQARRCQQHRARTRRINGIARTIALAEPFL